MNTVRDLLRAKRSRLVTIEVTSSVYRALLKLDDNQIGALIVTDDKGGLVGIVTERDACKAATRFGEDFAGRPVSDIMTIKLINCDIDDTVVQAMTTMENNKIRHLPVLHQGKAAGIISIRDAMKACIREMVSGEQWVHRQVLSAVAEVH